MDGHAEHDFPRLDPPLDGWSRRSRRCKRRYLGNRAGDLEPKRSCDDHHRHTGTPGNLRRGQPGRNAGSLFWIFRDGDGIVGIHPGLFANLGDHTRWWMAGMVILAGVAGSLVDSLLGATVQAIYYCPACQKETEKHPLHHCGTPTRQVRGLKWLNNDWVNFFAHFSGALIALAIGVIL